MARLFPTLTLLVGFAAVPFLGGCDHTVKENTATVTHPDGTVTQQDTKVVRKANGDVVTEQNKVNNP